MTSITDKAKKWASTAQTVGLLIMTVLTIVLSVSGGVFWVADMYMSYLGWGSMAATHIRTGEIGPALALFVSALPTLIQTVFIIAQISEAPFYDSKLLKYGFYISLVADNALDIQQMYDPSIGAVSFALAVVVALVAFSFCSEWLLGFFTPLAVVLVQEMMTRMPFDWGGGWTNADPRARRAAQAGSGGRYRPQPQPPARQGPQPRTTSDKKRSGGGSGGASGVGGGKPAGRGQGAAGEVGGGRYRFWGEDWR